MRILLIEDDPSLSSIIQHYVLDEGFRCEAVESYGQAAEKIFLYTYDLALVDLGLPDGEGLDLVKTLRQQSPETGIIIISARNAVDDRIKGLEFGADDYLSKPFHLPELKARMRALERRRHHKGAEQLTFEEFTFIPEKHEVQVHGNILSLRNKEYDLLLFFVVNKGRVLSKSAIAEHLWGDYMDEADSFDFLYNHIKNLRKKIQEAGGKDYIQTVYGLGYKFSRS
jgi:DNA-binding response OmpR family regulator